MTRQSLPPLRPQPPVRSRPRRRRGVPWSTVVGALLLVALLGVVAVLLLSDDEPRTAAPSGTAPVAESAAPVVAETPAASAQASPTPAAGFAPNSLVTLDAEALTLRAEPGVESEVLARLPAGQAAFVVAGPETADLLPWYLLSGMGVPYGSGCTTPEPGLVYECPAWLGWVAAAAEDGTPWVVPAATPPPCPAAEVVPTLVSISELPYTLRLICYGSNPLTFRAWWPAEPPAPTGAPCPAADAAIGWLVCQSTNANLLSADPAEPGGRLAVSLDPASGLGMPERGQWLDVTGHFDDPGAQRCGDVTGFMATDARELVFGCRLQFVVSAVAVAPNP